MAITGVTDYTNTYATSRTNGSNGVSGSTQGYLNGLKEKYPDVNITVADFKNGKQEDAYIFGSSGGNNIVIASNIIEKMASDPATAAKYEKYIAEVPEAAGIMKDGIEAHGNEMVACGTAIDKDGKVTYWSVSRHKPSKESQSVSYKKILQEQLEEKRAKKKEEEKLKEKRLEKAESLDKLLEKIKAKRAEMEMSLSEKLQEDGKGVQMDLTI